jgi:Flp pilus assembly protein TadG
MIAFLKRRGQALVEFALAATLIFFLLAAAVDLGFMFFALQGLHNAAQEGGSYGSRWLISDASGKRGLDASTIRDRVRLESGTRGGIGFVNLLDLNNNGVPDVPAGQSVAICVANPGACDTNSATGRPVVLDYIQVAMINDTNGNGDPLDDGAAPNFAPCANAANVTCFIRVSASFDYRLFFPLSPTFGRQRTLTSAFVMRLRDDVAREGTPVATPQFQPATPTPLPELALTISNFYYKTTSPRTVSIKVFVTLNGNPLTNAQVRANFTKGSTTYSNVTLSSIGNGYYTACNIGSFTSGGSVNADVTASNGTVSKSASASSTNVSFPDC